MQKHYHKSKLQIFVIAFSSSTDEVVLISTRNVFQFECTYGTMYIYFCTHTRRNHIITRVKIIFKSLFVQCKLICIYGICLCSKWKYVRARLKDPDRSWSEIKWMLIALQLPVENELSGANYFAPHRNNVVTSAFEICPKNCNASAAT